MSEPSLIDRQQGALRALEELLRQCQTQIATAEKQLASGRVAAVEQADQNQLLIDSQRDRTRQHAEATYTHTMQELEGRFQLEFGTAQQEYQTLKQRALARYEAEKTNTKKSLSEVGWETQTTFDATRNKPKRDFMEFDKQVKARAERLMQIGEEARAWLAECRLFRAPAINTEGSPDLTTVADPVVAFVQRQEQAEVLLARLLGHPLLKFFAGVGPFFIVLFVWLALIYPAGRLTEWHISWIAISGVAGVLIGGGIDLALYLLARGKVRQVFDPLGQALVDAELLRQHTMEVATARFQKEQAEIATRHQEEMSKANEKYQSARDAARQRRDEELARLEAKYPPKMAELRATYEADLTQCKQQHAHQLAEATAGHEKGMTDERQRAEHEMQSLAARAQSEAQAALTRWRDGVAQAEGEIAQLVADTNKAFPEWDQAAIDSWQPPEQLVHGVRFGQLTVRFDRLAADLEDRRLAQQHQAVYTMPALLDFPRRCSLLLRAAGVGRSRAVDVLQSVMLRILTAAPPGKVRFTIIDPVGLGQNFAGFMHLADYEEALVSGRIWTEPQQIEQRLSDMTVHMSNVIQKYLRNEYESIEHYNDQAGEVAEPFRVVVVANFPFGFTDAAMRYLMAVATTGARCGVYTLISVDTKLPLPHGFRIADLEASAAKLVWRDEAFVWKDETFERFPLQLDGLPDAEQFNQIIHKVGEGARNANRVEVPFEFIAPKPDQYWTSDSGRGIDVAIGRAGATKRQFLRLGRGTAQHMLIAGKTGSGKSTLLHALITNLALNYSPDEVQLYLIDFKKGVEFKTYAQFQLPHAKVIAIESEREFGLSVLQRLDAELKHRGDMFRDMNVQDLNAYRQAGGKETLPRILFIVDEFQEFFVEDDKIAQDVSLLLDRLVRQGRAFGIHVHLGSQTLGGTYSLARSTLGQFAIRIALQCSEADANLILSEENSAARLLSRPGEAIYNDANGRSEGNNLFQVVWLSDDRHEYYLKAIRELAQSRGVTTAGQIVFEGNIPADITKNHLLAAAIEKPGPVSLSALAWLGDAIAIKDPTAAIFRRQSGANVLLIGQQSEAALAMMMITSVSLSAQQPGAKFLILDGQAPDAMHVDQLPRVAAMLPGTIEAGSIRDTARMIGAMSEELERRQANASLEQPPIYLMIYDLQRFRDLRKADDDFGFSRGAEKPSPSKQLVALLREGPPLGLHVIVWCDTLNNVQRCFDRQTLREFETRVLFQMSVSDSSTLIDSPQASKLGPHRALLHSEERGLLEKFRPYRLPEAWWLEQVTKTLRERLPAAGGATTSGDNGAPSSSGPANGSSHEPTPGDSSPAMS
ncbi:MAG: AAA family ATPase [Planctomycetes bacterium]|nr:AAA family ATPase [Planctomycetota bacterium]